MPNTLQQERFNNAKQKVVTQLKELLEQRREGLIVYMGNYDTNQENIAKLSLLVVVFQNIAHAHVVLTQTTFILQNFYYMISYWSLVVPPTRKTSLLL